MSPKLKSKNLKKHKKEANTHKRNTKKPSRRSVAKNPALQPHLNLKTRYEEITDILSYANTLPEKDKAWLNSFVSEYINADMRHEGKKLHKSKKAKKICNDRNNARNRCIYTRAKATHTAVPFSHLTEGDSSRDEMDDVIDRLDKKYTYLSWDDE